MNLMAMVFVTELDRSLGFYRALGLTEDRRHGDIWAVLRLGEGLLGLHRTETLPSAERLRVKLSFEIGGERLEAIRERLTTAGVRVDEPIVDQPWGRSMLVIDPDGLPIEVAETA